MLAHTEAHPLDIARRRAVGQQSHIVDQIGSVLPCQLSVLESHCRSLRRDLVAFIIDIKLHAVGRTGGQSIGQLIIVGVAVDHGQTIITRLVDHIAVGRFPFCIIEQIMGPVARAEACITIGERRSLLRKIVLGAKYKRPLITRYPR